jgi:hypothetical protein
LSKLCELAKNDVRFPGIVVPSCPYSHKRATGDADESLHNKWWWDEPPFYSFFLSGYTLGKSELFSLRVPVNAWINAFRKTLKTIHHRRFRIFEAPAKGRFGSEPILGLISNHSRQSADNSLPDGINRIIGIMCRVENCHVVEYRLDIAIKVAAV